MTKKATNSCSTFARTRPATNAAAAFTLRRDTDDTVLGRPAGFQFTDLGWLWRIPASAAIYFVLFFAAGLIIWPFVQDFYSAQLEQERLGLLNFEWEYLNGVWFALIALPLLRPVPGDWLRAGITAGVAFCLIRGIGGLIVPNPSMPTSIRMWHMFEVGWSNFVYGLAVAYGSVEGSIYTTVPVDFQPGGLIEVLGQSFLLSFLVFYWVNHPEKRWLTWTLAVGFAIVLVLPALGLLMG